jgi:medium-chain acyl-[acyl-carrier-protein] hydrolase
LTSDRQHYQEIGRQSREAATRYAGSLSVQPFEAILQDAAQRGGTPSPRAETAKAAVGLDALSPEKRRLLALRLRRKPSNAWFPGAETAAAPRLFWFPHAGAGTSATARLKLPGYAICPARLPARESRLTEAPTESMAALVDALAGAIAPYTSQPFAFFGHSMGAAVAFELTRVLRKRGLPLPGMLIASAARAPQFRRNHVPRPAPSDERLIEELRRMGGVPEELLADASFVAAVLPALKADAALYREYVYGEDTPLPVAIRAYGGVDDGNITRAHLEAWGEQTTGSFAVRLFPGGHFYLNTAREEFAAALTEDLSWKGGGAQEE